MNNRSKIIEVALKLFAIRGYDGVGVKEIAECAGVTKPTLYHYFGNKKGLLEIVLEEKFSRLNTLVEEALVYNHDLPLTLNKIAAAYFNFAKEKDTFYRMQLAMSFAPPESEASKVVSKYIKEQYEMLEGLFIKASEDHGNMKGRHKAYAATFLGMINTYITLFLTGELELEEQLTYQAVHQFMHGIYS
ncbi:TetR/AcrR family transcriptional regulator [Orenia marismortui]|uniref:TetR/AcrR family transcriptional regulator n=1 Tax=Orenia marismortui TaxID=46469 RepID=UPI000375C8A5|nr:TetR/AcrR family transcriptional regulator [Orenia marismortui]